MKGKSVATAVVTALILLLLFAIAESAVRVRQWIRYGHAGTLDSLFAVDPALNLKIPIARAETKTARINSLGFRGPEIPRVKPDDGIRVAYLGASTTYCAEASSNEATWPHLATEALRQTHANMDYINAAVPGYGLNAMHRTLNYRVAPLQPDVIVIYEATNELSYETRALAVRQGIYRNPEELGWLSEQSLLWFLLEKNLKIARSRQAASAKVGRLEVNPALLGTSFRKELAALILDAKKIAPVVAVPTFSQQIRDTQSPERQLDAAASALYYMPYMTPELLFKGYARYNDIIREVASETGAIPIDGEMDIPGDPVHFNDTVHFKDEGNRKMAARVAKGVVESREFRALAQSRR